jgi:hypothetical protein
MGPILVVAIVSVIAVLWVRATRRSRAAWLARLNLPGTWTAEADGREVMLELTGDLDRGEYVETSAGRTERGKWRLVGHSLVFTSAAGENACDLRVFEEGRIGLDGPGRERRIYQRPQSNVVPLRRGHS